METIEDAKAIVESIRLVHTTSQRPSDTEFKRRALKLYGDHMAFIVPR